MTLITPELCRKHGACYSDKKLRAILGKGKTLLEVCDLDIPVGDRLWALLRFSGLDDRTWRLLAARWAERALPIYEREHPGDDRPRKAIAAARAYANGKLSGGEMAAAENAAGAAARAAEGDAAWPAAAMAAAGAAAWAAEGAAAWAAEGDGARAAAWDGARAAARDGARAAARDGARAAARAAAWDGARVAAGDAAWAAQISDIRAVLSGTSVDELSPEPTP